MPLTLEELRQQQTAEFQKHPHSFWAKKFNEEIHITQREPHQTLCGSSAALLGNNYAPYKMDKPICEQCLKIKLEAS